MSAFSAGSFEPMCPRVRGVFRARIGGSVLVGGTGAFATAYEWLPPGVGIVNLGRSLRPFLPCLASQPGMRVRPALCGRSPCLYSSRRFFPPRAARARERCITPSTRKATSASATTGMGICWPRASTTHTAPSLPRETPGARASCRSPLAKRDRGICSCSS